MEKAKKSLEEVVGSIKQIRDEVKVQIHLGKAEAKDEWGQLEKKWEDLKRKSEPFTETAEETAENVGSAMKLAAEELLKGYDRVKKLIK